MRKKLLAGASALGLASSALILGALPATADGFFLDEKPTDSPNVPWSTSGDICDEPEVKVTFEMQGAEKPVSISPDVININPDRKSGTIDVSELAPGYTTVAINCEDDTFSEQFSVARYTVTKAVEGDAPAGAAFGFQVTAEPDNPDVDPAVFDFELAAGESASFYDFDVTTWSVEETNSQGASEVRADNTEFESEEAEDFVATVVNVFPETVEPDPEPEPAPKPQPAPDTTPAAPVKAQPAFTG